MSKESLSQNSIINVSDLQVKFETSEQSVTAVNSLSFFVNRGETLAIVGESGSGKSVTSLALMRLIEQGGGKITNGQIMFQPKGQDINLLEINKKSMRQIRGADISMIFQEPMTSLNPAFTVGEQISESIILHQHKSKKEALNDALTMLELVRIPEAKNVLSRYPHQLSGGMRQRVMIAMALSCKPALLIADEPTTALDVTIQAQILSLISSLQKELNMAVIFITHDMGVVAEVADRVLVMFRGDKVEEGSADEIFNNPQHPYTKSLLAAVPKLGSMTGTDYPQKFELMNIEDNSQYNQTEEFKVVNYANPPLLQVRDLVTRFDIRTGIFNRLTSKVHAVEHINFELYSGETLSLVGESGCGKSTTGRSILKLVDIESGSIEFEKKEINRESGVELQKLRKNIQFIFQDPYASLDPRLTIGFSIMEPMLIHNTMPSVQEAEKRVVELLERVGLNPNHSSRYPHEFSGGQRQRICIARALALNPKIVICDESVSALDVSIQAQIINLLIDLQKEFCISYLFISHDMAVVERISHRVAVMQLGQIVEIGTRREIFENPQHPYTQKLMAAVPIADPSRRKIDRQLMVDEIPSPIRKIGDNPVVEPLVAISKTHFVAKHQISNLY